MKGYDSWGFLGEMVWQISNSNTKMGQQILGCIFFVGRNFKYQFVWFMMLSQSRFVKASVCSATRLAEPISIGHFVWRPKS